MSNPESASCDGCPYAASIEVATHELRETKQLYKSEEDRAIGLGFLAFKLKILEEVASKIVCAGPQNNVNNVQICNIIGPAKDAQDSLMGPTQNAKILLDYSPYIDPEDIGDNVQTFSDGQYL